MLIAPQISPEAVEERLAKVRERIRVAALRFGRDPEQITLLAVSKGQPAAAVRIAAAAGQREFGESYLQEAAAKTGELAGLALVWHFIGSLQANKTRAIAEHYNWVHTVH